MRWWCGAGVLGFALACGGATTPSPEPAPAPDSSPAPAPEEPPAPLGPLEPIEDYGYAPSPDGRGRFSEPPVGQDRFVAVDGAKLRAEPNEAAAVVEELPLAASVTILASVGEPVEVVGRWNRWVEVEHEGKKGFLFGSLLTPLGGQKFWEAGGETRWAVSFSRDFKPLVRVQGENMTEALSLELNVTQRFQGGLLEAGTDDRGDFDGLIQVTLCDLDERTDGPRCASGSAVFGQKLEQLTPPDAWRFKAQANRGNCADEKPTRAVSIPLEQVNQVELPSYMRGPNTTVPCFRVARVDGGPHDRKAVIACRESTGGKGEPVSYLVRRFIELAPDRWGRVACSGGMSAELEEHLLYEELSIDDLGELQLGGRFEDPEVILEGPRGSASRRLYPPGNPALSELEKFAEHPDLGPLYRVASTQLQGDLWSAAYRSGIVVPRIEGGYTVYAWEPDLTGLAFTDGTKPARYEASDALSFDFFHPELKESDLRLVGSTTAGPVWALPDGDPLSQEMATAHAPMLGERAELGAYPWLFVRGPDDKGFYRLVRSDLRRPLMAEPILYAYADEPTALSIAFGPGLIVRGTHPVTAHGWDVVVHPDGALEYAEGQVIDRLFWDGVSGLFDPPARGWVVPGARLEEHLRKVLPTLGLAPGREIDEALEAWVPSVQGAAWVRVGVHEPAHIERLAPLRFEPQPDTLIRVMVELQPLDRPVPIEPPAQFTGERRGLTVVEWGYVVRGGR